MFLPRRRMTWKGALVAAAVLSVGVSLGVSLCGCAAATDAPPAPAPSDGQSAASAVGTWGDKDAPPYVAFSDDGTMLGNDGCNGFSGKWQQAGEEILFADVGTTLKSCPGVDEWLTQARSAIVQGDSLSVRDADDTVIGTLPRTQ